MTRKRGRNKSSPTSVLGDSKRQTLSENKMSANNSQISPSSLSNIQQTVNAVNAVQPNQQGQYNSGQTFTLSQLPMDFNGHYVMMNSASPILHQTPVPCTPTTFNTSNLDVMSNILERLDSMDKRLAQLDIIQSTMSKITTRMDEMEKKIGSFESKVKTIEQKMNTMAEKVSDIERSCDFDGDSLADIRRKQRELDALIVKMAKLEEEQKARNTNLRSEIVDLKSRSMRDNLIFYKIAEERDECCETKILEFIETKLGIANATTEIKLHRAHRIGAYRPDRTRPIVAKFAFYPEREKVRRAAKNLKGTPYGLSEQYPKEVMETRRRLIPVMKQARQEGKDAYLAVDKLYIDKQLYRG